MREKTPADIAVRKAGEAYMLWISAIRLGKGACLPQQRAYMKAREEAVRMLCEVNSERPGCVRWDCSERYRRDVVLGEREDLTDADFELCSDPEHAQPWNPSALNDYQREFIEAQIMREAVEVAAAALNKEVLARI